MLMVIAFAFALRSAAEPAYHCLTPEMSYLPTDHGEYDIDTIRESEILSRFQPVGSQRVTLGYTGREDHWYRFELDGESRSSWRVLEFSNPRLGEVTLYYPNADGRYSAHVLGIRHPFWDRQVSGLTPAYPVHTEAEGHRICFVRVRHFGSLRFEARLWDWGVYIRHASLAVSLSLLLSGAMIAMGVYNVCIFLHLRQWGYLWLALFLFSANFNLMVTSGTASMLLWPEPNLLAQRAMTITSIATLCIGIGLCNYLLRSAPGGRQFARANLAFGAIAIAGGATSFSGHPAAFYLLCVGGILAPIGVTAMAISALRAKQRIAIGFLACWWMVLVGALATSLMGPGYLPATALTEHFLFVGIFFAAIGWTFTLTRQIKVREQELRRRLQQEVEERTEALQDAIEEVKTLHGLLPICCACKKIRDDEGYWHHVETYLQARTSADFSHGLCPDCAGNLYPEYFPRQSGDGNANRTPNEGSAQEPTT